MAAAVEKTAALRQPFFLFFCVRYSTGARERIREKKYENKIPERKWQQVVCVRVY
jgi:hypothetical protein